MDIKVDNNSFFALDLDDTLYQEIDFLQSAYRFISEQLFPVIGKEIDLEMYELYKGKEVVFDKITEKYKLEISMKTLIDWYRFHTPTINLNEGVATFLQILKENDIKISLITDGRSTTQRNKLKALGIEDLFCDTIISEEFGTEKPNINNFKFFENKYPSSKFFYIGDNFSKDFVTPNALNWTTIGIKDSGTNIHKQNYDLQNNYLPHYICDSFTAINLIFKQKQK